MLKNFIFLDLSKIVKIRLFDFIQGGGENKKTK